MHLPFQLIHLRFTETLSEMVSVVSQGIFSKLIINTEKYHRLFIKHYNAIWKTSDWHDTDIEHTANAVKDYLDMKTYNGIQLAMDWPPNSKDLNMIKSAWNHLDRQCNKRQGRSKEEF